ncbi:neuromedin-U receptor 2-like [Antedon mediterranea]|uniref:neuromedin-U receptor 2-like n=1 Tax=Antedon mediterranea TaxID=105859 RepID=UPI003AF89F03
METTFWNSSGYGANDVLTTEATTVCETVYHDQLNYYMYSSLDRWFLFCFLPTVVAIGIIGNIIIITLITKDKTLRTSPNMYLLALAVSDIIYLLSENLRGWVQYATSPVQADSSGIPFGVLKLFLFTRSSSILASCFIIIAVSFDRYFCICKPMRSLTSTKKTAIKVCIAIWLLTSLYSSRMFFTAHLEKKCIIWPESDGIDFPEYVMYLYSCDPTRGSCVTLFVTEQLLVLIVIPISITLHILMIMELRRVGQDHISEDSARAAHEAKARMIKILMTIVVIYAFCMAPYRLLNLFQHFLDLKLPSNFWIIYYINRILASLNSSVNPIVYGLISKKFRHAIKNICFPPQSLVATRSKRRSHNATVCSKI